MNKKLSIAIANYNNEQYLENCLDHLLNQAYQNVEIIVVNDGSPGDCDSIMNKYLALDERIKYVKHEKNKGLFQARLTGAEAATGDYIAFLDADDYTSVDFYHAMVRNAEENNSDIVIGKIVLKFDDGRMDFYNLFDTNFEKLEGKECLEEYFRQEGLNFSWHTGCNQLYSMKLWRQAEPYYKKIKKRLLMTEDFAFSTVLFYFAKKVTKIDNDCLYYCKHEITSTSINDINFTKEKNNITDLITSFSFVEEFLKEKKVYDKYKNNFQNWKRLYANMHRGYIKDSKIMSEEEKTELQKLMNTYCSNTKEIKSSVLFSSIVSPWNDGLEKIKKAILDKNIKVVSFDIFDTLVCRPFFQPLDLFKLLDVEYRKDVKDGVDFSEIRVNAEQNTRETNIKNKKNEDITLKEIYDTIQKDYNIDKATLKKLKDLEIELEKKFCTKKKSSTELYNLAKDLGKTIIITSDMYLPEKTIKSILDKNGFKEYHKLYLSCEIGKTKATGNLYKYVLNDLNIEPNELLHIGDNYDSDYQVPKNLGIESKHFPKSISVMLNKEATNNLSQMLTNSMPFWFDTKNSLNFIGIRTMLAMVANKYFDNPYRSFNYETDFNADPFLIGYYALGMYMFSSTNWLLKNIDGKYDKISFMARDGYLSMESYKILKELYKNAPQEEYMYVSRRALLQIIIKDELDLYKLPEIIKIDKQSPKSMIKYVNNILNINEEKLKLYCENKKISYTKNFKSIKEFNIYIKILIDHFYDKAKIQKTHEKLEKYFSNILGEKPAVFDVGYSGRPEYYMSKLCNKNIGTFFLNINEDCALKYAENGNFELKTFFPAKPAATGNAYEMIISKQAPSCIGYNCQSDTVAPIFEKYNEEYQIAYIIETMQKASLQFVKDVVDTFGEYTKKLYYQDYYMALPILAYLNSSRRLDKHPLSAVEFEDNIRINSSIKMIDDMDNDLVNKNQQSMDTLLNKKSIKVSNGRLNYNGCIDLNNKNKFSRLLFYSLYDRNTLKRRISEITYRFRKKKK